jgi:hypothetical protein
MDRSITDWEPRRLLDDAQAADRWHRPWRLAGRLSLLRTTVLSAEPRKNEPVACR